MLSTLCVTEVTNHCEFPSWSRKDLDLRADSWVSGSEWVSWWDLRHPREQKAGDTRGTCRARAQSVTTEVPTVVKSFFTVLSAERLLLGVGPLVSLQRGVVGELLGAEMAAVGLLAHVGLLVNTQVRRLHEPLDIDVAFFSV